MAKIINPKRFIISVIVVSLMIGLGGFKLFQIGRSYLGYGNSFYEKVGHIPINKVKDKENFIISVPFLDFISIYNNNSLRTYTIDGVETWTIGQKITSPALFSGDDILYLVDKETGFINAISQEGDIVWTIDMGKTIQNFIANSSNVAVIVEEEGFSKVSVFDKNGKGLGEVNIKSATIMGLTTSQDGEIIALSLLSTENNVIETNIVLYSKEGKLLGGNTYDDIIGSLFFSSNNHLMSVGVESIVAFHKEKGQLWTKETSDSINKIAWNGIDTLAINYVNTKKSILDIGHKSYISIISVDGLELVELPLKGIAKAMDSIADKVIVAGERTLYLGNSRSEKVEEKKVNKDIKEIFFINDKILAVKTEDAIEIFQIE